MSTGPIVLCVLVRNEVDIIGDVVRWHLNHGVDHVIAMDNDSTDGTSGILEDYARLGVLTRHHQPSDTYQQDVWANDMARMAFEDHGAEWVIPSDADEFWIPDSDTDLRTALAAVPPGTHLFRCRRRNLIPAREDLGILDWPDATLWYATPERTMPAERLRDLRLLDYPYLYRHLPHKVLVRPRYLTGIARGAHSARFSRPVREADAPITVYHAPFRDTEEFATSTRRIAGAVANDTSASPDVSAKYRRWAGMTPDAALAEAVPSADRLHRDFRAGAVSIDTRLRDAVAQGRGDTPARYALSGGKADVIRPTDAAAPAIPILVLGGSPATRAAVAERLRAVGARGPDPEAADRIAALHATRWGMAEDDFSATATLRYEFETELLGAGSCGHGEVVADEGLSANLDLWMASAGDGTLSPAIVLLSDEGTPEDAATEITTRGRPRLIAPASCILSAPPEALCRSLSALGVWIPRRIAAEADSAVPRMEERPSNWLDAVGLGLSRALDRPEAAVPQVALPGGTGTCFLLLAPAKSGADLLKRIMVETEIVANRDEEGNANRLAMTGGDILRAATADASVGRPALYDASNAKHALYAADVSEVIREAGVRSQRIAFSEPVIVHLVPVFADAVEAAGYVPRFVHVVHDPGGRSGERADIDAHQMDWLVTHLEAERYTRGRPRIFVSSEEIAGGETALADHLDIMRLDTFPWPRASANCYLNAEHFSVATAAVSLAEAKKALSRLLRDPHDPRATAMLDRVARSLADIPTGQTNTTSSRSRPKKADVPSVTNEKRVRQTSFIGIDGKGSAPERPTFRRRFEFRVLNALSRTSPLLPRRMTDRFARSAKKRRYTIKSS